MPEFGQDVAGAVSLGIGHIQEGCNANATECNDDQGDYWEYVFFHYVVVLWFRVRGRGCA